MVRPRRYNNYRGRRSKGKTALAALLVLVILAAVVVILLQRHIIYDETGLPRMEVPWKEATQEETTTKPELDLVIQPPEKTVGEIRGIILPVGAMTQELWNRAEAGMDPAYNALAAVLKDETGTVWFDAPSAVSGSVEVAEDTSEVLAALIGSEFHTIACVSCFHDPKAAAADADGLGLKDAEGYLFYDGANQQWMDPAKPAARQYVCELAVEAAKLGFDEILLTEFSYPTDGKLEQIAYGEGEKSEHLKLLLEELRDALEPYGTVLSVLVSPETVTAGQEESSGQRLAEIAEYADRICVETSVGDAAALNETIKAALGDRDLFVPIITEDASAWSGSSLLIS